jgi:nitrite reductase/ring-hydroxylating ferredoxin subunit
LILTCTAIALPQMDKNGFVDTAVFPQFLQSGQMVSVQINGRALILTRYEGEVIAFSGRCPHAAAPLEKGTLYRHKLTCPDHGYCFDIRNGRTLWPPDEAVRLRRYPVKEKDGRLWVRVA